MKSENIFTLAAMTIVPWLSLAAIYGDIPDDSHAWSVHDWNRPKPTKVEPAEHCGGAPSDAIVLFDGTRASLDANWQDEKGNPTKWEIRNGGFTSKAGWGLGSIRTRAEFGDCQLHLEYRHNPENVELGQGPQMRGNSGVFLMGQATGYEVQVLESYYTSKEMEGREGYVDNYADGQAGSVYAENPPLVNPARKPGEWQVYDIIFHQPVWEGDKLLHPGSLTVFFNGVLVQDHWEMEGLTTHCHRRPLAPHATKGPLALQDHGCEVTYRNIWIRPLASRWANTTHSAMSAKKADVLAVRAETAAKLAQRIVREVGSPERAYEFAEVVSYDERYLPQFIEAFDAFKGKAAKWSDEEKKANQSWFDRLNNALKQLHKGGVAMKVEPFK